MDQLKLRLPGNRASTPRIGEILRHHRAQGYTSNAINSRSAPSVVNDLFFVGRPASPCYFMRIEIVRFHVSQ